MKLRALLLAIFVCAAGAVPGFAQMGSSGVEGTAHMGGRVTGKEFLEHLMRDTAAKIEWSRIAQARTADPEIKAFAAQVEYQNRVFGYDIYQLGPRVQAQFEPAVSGKLKEKSETLRSLPADQLDVAYLKDLQEVGHDTIDLVNGEYNAVLDVDTKGVDVRVSNTVAKEDSEAHDLLKKRKK